MKILYIERTLFRDSLVFDQIKRISERGIDYKCIAVQNESCPHLLHPKIREVNSPFFPKIESIKNFLFYKSVSKIVRENNIGEYDILHAHFTYPEGYSAYKLSKKFGIPYVLTGRGDDILIYPKKSNFLKNTIRKVIINADAFVGVSKNIIDSAEKLTNRKLNSFHVPNGIPECFNIETQVEKPLNNSRVVMFAGSLLAVKNVLYMLEAFKLVNDSNRDIKFKIAGEGLLKRKMKRRIRELGMENKVVFLGQLKHDDLAKEMNNASVFCLPSISEGWPNVIMEAMACGTPVVGSNVGGIPEQIISDEYGYLCDPYSSQDIAYKIIKALNRENWDYHKISERGKLFTREDTAKKIVDIYKKTLNKKS